MIPELQKDVEIKYILIRSFKYYNPEEAEVFNGHPHIGRVYRSVFNLHTKHHRLLLPNNIVMGFNLLTGDNGSAAFDLVEITIDNILDLDIQEEDLEIFLHPNDDIFQPQIMIEGLGDLQNQLEQSLKDEADFSSRASEVVLDLYQVNPIKAEVLLQFASLFLDSEMESHQDAAYDLRMSRDGMSLNIGEALRSLDTYSGGDRRSNLDINDLLDAMVSIGTELERQYISE